MIDRRRAFSRTKNQERRVEESLASVTGIENKPRVTTAVRDELFRLAAVYRDLEERFHRFSLVG